jgi:hypothetical protein
MSSKASSGAAKDQNKLSAQEDELNFQRQAWLAQQQRMWQLQDRAYKQQAIAGFSKFGKQSGITPPNQNAEMSQLDNFDPNKLGSVGGATPAQSSPLGQFAGGKLPPSTGVMKP